MTEDESAIYYRCLNCGSERIKITGEPKFADNNIVTCTVCGNFWTKRDFDQANFEAVSKLLNVDGKPN